jgi:hypothetical protein
MVLIVLVELGDPMVYLIDMAQASTPEPLFFSLHRRIFTTDNGRCVHPEVTALDDLFGFDGPRGTHQVAEPRLSVAQRYVIRRWFQDQCNPANEYARAYRADYELPSIVIPLSKALL